MENFIRKNNSYDDYDVRMDEFILENSSSETKVPSPIYPNLKENEERTSSTPHTHLSSEDNKIYISDANDNESLINTGSIHNLQPITHSVRMKLKKEKAKKLLDKKTQREELFEVVNLENSHSTQPTQLTKKELKMLRNRVSAQNSRDRKKKEFDELRLISQNIIDENRNLKKQLYDKNRELTSLREKLSNLCDNCKTGRRPEITDRGQGITGKLKYSLMAGLLAVVCLLGTLGFNSDGDSLPTTSRMRVLVQEVPESVSPITDQNTETGIMPYNKDIEVYKPNYPFRITKEKKQDNIFLDKKRYDFLVRIDDKNNKFLNEDTCPNTDTLNWSIQEENGLLPVIDSKITNFDYNIIDKEFYRKNVKSMYCRDFITAEQNSRIFQTMFEKVNFEDK
jgi:hypothetical protein